MVLQVSQCQLSVIVKYILRSNVLRGFNHTFVGNFWCFMLVMIVCDGYLLMLWGQSSLLDVDIEGNIAVAYSLSLY